MLRASQVLRSLTAALVLTAASALPAQAQWSFFASGSFVTSSDVARPTWAVFAPGSTNGGGVQGGPLSYSLAGPRKVRVTVQDCCIIGDVLEAAINGSYLGRTSDAALDGGIASSGTFMTMLGAGNFTLDFWNITLSYVGETSPFGGGTVPGYFSPAGHSFTIETAEVPEPASIALLSTGLVGLGVVARRRRRA